MQGLGKKSLANKGVPSQTTEQRVEYILTEAKIMITCRFKMTEAQYFDAIVDAGLEYIEDHMNKAWHTEMARDKGFWHWYRQIYVMAAQKIGKPCSDQHGNSSVPFAEWHGWVKVAAQNYSCDQVMRSIYNGQEYTGRVLW